MKITPHGRMWEATPHRCIILHIEEACLLKRFSRFVVKSPDISSFWVRWFWKWWPPWRDSWRNQNTRWSNSRHFKQLPSRACAMQAFMHLCLLLRLRARPRWCLLFSVLFTPKQPNFLYWSTTSVVPRRVCSSRRWEPWSFPGLLFRISSWGCILWHTRTAQGRWACDWFMCPPRYVQL